MSFLMYLSKTIMNHKFTSTNWYFLIYDSLDWNLVTYIKCRECTAWRHTKDKNWFASDWNDDMSLDETLHMIAVLIFLHRKWQNLDGNMADTTLFTFSCLSFLYEYYFTKMFESSTKPKISLFSLFMYKATYVKRKITSIPGKSKQPFNLASRIYLFQGFNHMLHFLLTQNYFFCY